MRNVAIKKRYVNGGVRLSFFVQEGDIKPGEYCLIPVAEADDKDARIAELEKQLAERSPGVMPEAVADLLTACQFLDSIGAEGAKLVQHEADKVREYYAPPFVFTGEPAWYASNFGSIEIVRRLNGELIGIIGDDWVRVAVDGTFDGTFPGGRIVRRV